MTADDGDLFSGLINRAHERAVRRRIAMKAREEFQLIESRMDEGIFLGELDVGEHGELFVEGMFYGFNQAVILLEEKAGIVWDPEIGDYKL
jgi:hypothetical protein